MDEKITLEEFLSLIGPRDEHGMIKFNRAKHGSIIFNGDDEKRRFLGALRFVYVWAERLLVFTIDELSVEENHCWEKIELDGVTIEIPLNPTETSIFILASGEYKILSPSRKNCLFVNT